MKKLLIALITLGSLSVSAQSFSKRNQNTDFCKKQYSNIVETQELFEKLIEEQQITGTQEVYYYQILSSMEKISDATCKSLIGKRKTKKLKAAILD